MNPAIHFDSKVFFRTVEINNKRPNRILAAKLPPLKLLTT